MMLNKNTAVQFYGRRPVLGRHLPGNNPEGHLLSGANLGAGLGTTAATVYLPGSVGSKLLGSTLDKLADRAGQFIQAAFPTLGTILYMVTDAINWAVKPTAAYLDAMTTGVVMYLPDAAANDVCQFINDNKSDLVLDAFKDCVYAFYRRVSPTGAQATDLKTGKDWVVAELVDLVMLQALGVGKTSSRLADKISARAKTLGAEDWQIGAAVGFGIVVGLPSAGFPANLTINLPDALKSTIGSVVGNSIQITGASAGKTMLSVPDLAAKYLNMLAPTTATTPDLTSTSATTAWIASNFQKKSGVNRSGVISGSAAAGAAAGSVLPMLAAAAAAFFAFRK